MTAEEDDLRAGLDELLSDSGLRKFKAPGWDGVGNGCAFNASLADDPMVASALRAGASDHELAERLSVSVNTIARVRSILLRRGVIERRRPGGRPIKYNAEVIETVMGLYSGGMRIIDISRKASVSRDAVVMIIRRERAKPRDVGYAEAA